MIPVPFVRAMLHSAPPSQHSAFTLIELLIVIAIVGILAALTFPMVSSARSQAQLVKCVSNLRQIVNASVLSAAENSNRFPNLHGYVWEQGSTWIADGLAPYLSATVGQDPAQVLRCPAAEQNAAQAWLESHQYCHYRYNIWYAQNQRPIVGYTQAMLFFDTTYLNWPAGSWAHFPGNGAEVNVGYADGHVLSMPAATFTAQNPNGNELQNAFFRNGWVQ